MPNYQDIELISTGRLYLHAGHEYRFHTQPLAVWQTGRCQKDENIWGGVGGEKEKQHTFSVINIQKKIIMLSDCIFASRNAQDMSWHCYENNNQA